MLLKGDEGGDGGHGLSEGRVANELPVGDEVASLRRSGGAVLNTGGDGDGEDGRENRGNLDKYTMGA